MFTICFTNCLQSNLTANGPEGLKNAIHSKCKIQFSLQTNTWSVTFFLLSNIEFFISYPIQFAIETDRKSIYLCLVCARESTWISNSIVLKFLYSFYGAHRFRCIRWCVKRKESLLPLPLSSSDSVLQQYATLKRTECVQVFLCPRISHKNLIT